MSLHRRWVFVNGCDGVPLSAYQDGFDDEPQLLSWEEARDLCVELAAQLPGVWVRAVELVEGPSVQMSDGRFTDGEGNPLGGVRSPTDEEIEEERAQRADPNGRGPTWERRPPLDVWWIERMVMPRPMLDDDPRARAVLKYCHENAARLLATLRAGIKTLRAKA